MSAITTTRIGAPSIGRSPSGLGRATRGAGRRAGRWLGIFVPVILVSTFLVYGLGALSNANPAASVLGDTATPADIARINHQFGLDRPFFSQYVHWLGNALQGNLGSSYFTQIPVSQSISQRLPVDLSLAIVAALFAVIFGGLAGTLAAVKQGSWIDRGITLASTLLATLPAFVVGIGLVVIFSTTLKVLPSAGYTGFTVNTGQWFERILLPSLALSLELGVGIARQLRTSLVEELRKNYVTGAVVRGLRPSRILIVHALRNAAGPALTVLGAGVPLLIGGAVVTETVFALPGLGQLALSSAAQRDVPVVQGVLLVTSALVIVSNLVVKAALGWLRPSGGR
ncbi:MAG: Peptide/nickel transport system permease protein [Frankiales bacterium]|nr:Peptide/nickel transport system permease protein [Frankiales bacterium]